MMVKRRSKFLLLIVLLLIFSLFTLISKKNIQLEYVKDLIRKSKGTDLDNLFNQKMINKSLEKGNSSYTFQNLTFLIGMYEISKDFHYILEAKKIFQNYSSQFDTPSGIPRISTDKTVNVDIFSQFALEYYYVADYFLNFTYSDTVDKGLNSINSLLEINRTVDQVNIMNPFKSLKSDSISKFYPLLLNLFMSTGIQKFKDMYDQSLALIIPNLKNLTREECYFPLMLLQESKDSSLGINLLDKYCLQEISDLGNCGNVDFEIYFYMYRLTNKVYWREVGWNHLLSFGHCLNPKDLRFAYLLFSTEFSLDGYVFSNGFPISKRGFGNRKRYLPVKQDNCLDCIDGYGLDSLLNGAFS